MKKTLLFLLLLPALQLFAQTNPITAINISLPTDPDANTANWGTGTSMFTITAMSSLVNGHINPAVEESKILVTIKQNGAKICGSYTGSTAPDANFNAVSKVWSGANAASLLGKACILPPGDYEICVQFFGYGAATVVPLSDEKSKPFTIRGNDQQSLRQPSPILPANNTVISEADIKKPITFRWTPVLPRPTGPVTYRLKVWQLMEGQSSAQAMKANQPVVTTDVDGITQAIITNLITGPCKPPYLCNFVWNVQALTQDGKPIGGNNGTSESWGIISSLPLSAYVNGSKDSSIIDSCTMQFSFNHPGGGGGYELKVIDITVNACIYPCPSTCNGVCSITPVLDYHTNLTSLTIKYNNTGGISTDVSTGNAVVPSPNGLLIAGHKYMVICCEGSGATTTSSNCVSFVYNGCGTGGGTCACGTNWGYFVVSKAGDYAKYACGDTAHIPWQCGQPFAFTTTYSCTPASVSCTPITSWKVTKDGAPFASGTGNANLGGNFTPVTSGTYIITLDASCNGKVCHPCTYTIVVSGCKETGCTCGNWGTFVVGDPRGDYAKYDCGSEPKIPWKCNQPFVFSTTFTCKSVTRDCVAATTWQVTGPDGSTVQSGTGNNNLGGSFTPTANGTYTVTVNASCNGKACPGCTYYVVVEGCKETGCACGNWGTFVVGDPRGDYAKYDCGSEPKIPWKCNQPFVFSTTFTCKSVTRDCVAATTWQVTGPDGSTVQSGTGNNNLGGSFTPTANGTYTVTVNASCNGKACPGCTYYVVVEGCKDTGCACGNWGTFVVGDPRGDYAKYDCGSEPKIPWKCNQPFVFSTTFACKSVTRDCVAATTWQVTGPDGSTVQSGTGNNNLGGSFTPTANGTYTVTVNASCNGKPCPGCTYYVVVEGCKDTGCACGNWGTFVVGDPRGDYAKYDCGSEPKIPWKCNQPFVFSTTFACKSVTRDCVAATTWQVTGPDGSTVQSGTGNNNLGGSFTPTANGTYTVTVNASCNGKACPGCTYYVVVEGCKDTGCACGNWGTFVVTQGHDYAKYNCGSEPKIPWKCNQPFVFSTTFACKSVTRDCVAATTWQVTGPDGSTVQSGTGNNNLGGSFTPTANGTYTVTVNASCNGKACPGCTYYVVVEGCKETACSCNPDRYITATTAAGGILNIHCGDSKIYDYGTTITLTPQNICTPATCTANWSMNIYDAQTNAFVTSGTGSGSSAFTFTLNSMAGYKIEFSSNCGGNKCPCVFWIRTNPVAGCSCGDWGTLSTQNSTIKYACGTKIPWKCNLPFIFNTTYQCSGAASTCNAKTTWEVTKDGQTVGGGTGNNNLAGNFTPVTNGVYTITLTAECNGIACKPCTYAVAVDGCTVPPCDPCKTLGVTVKDDAVTITSASSDEVLLSGTLSGLSSSTITKVTMEVVSLNIRETGDKECAKCTENKEWGNFINPATANFSGFSVPVLTGGSFGREWTWTNLTPIACDDGAAGGGTGQGGAGCTGCIVPPAGGNKVPVDAKVLKAGTPGAEDNSFSLPISLPAGSSLSCCSDEVTICIRYTWWDGCCHACDTIKCYVLQRKPLMLKQSVTPKK